MWFGESILHIPSYMQEAHDMKPILGGRMFGTLVGLGHAPSAAGCDQNCFENYQ